jgi:hypothetical protein
MQGLLYAQKQLLGIICSDSETPQIGNVTLYWSSSVQSSEDSMPSYTTAPCKAVFPA